MDICDSRNFFYVLQSDIPSKSNILPQQTAGQLTEYKQVARGKELYLQHKFRNFEVAVGAGVV